MFMLVLLFQCYSPHSKLFYISIEVFSQYHYGLVLPLLSPLQPMLIFLIAQSQNFQNITPHWLLWWLCFSRSHHVTRSPSSFRLLPFQPLHVRGAPARRNTPGQIRPDGLRHSNVLQKKRAETRKSSSAAYASQTAASTIQRLGALKGRYVPIV